MHLLQMLALYPFFAACGPYPTHLINVDQEEIELVVPSIHKRPLSVTMEAVFL